MTALSVTELDLLDERKMDVKTSQLNTRRKGIKKHAELVLEIQDLKIKLGTAEYQLDLLESQWPDLSQVRGSLDKLFRTNLQKVEVKNGKALYFSAKDPEEAKLRAEKFVLDKKKAEEEKPKTKKRKTEDKA